MKIEIILLFLIGILVSGCLSNPIQDVPIVNVTVKFVEKNGEAVAENLTISQGTVNILRKPADVQVVSYPTISGRAMIKRDKNYTVGPWENLKYEGSGIYSFNLPFKETMYPQKNDNVIVSIYVIKLGNNNKSERIGFVNKNMTWK